MPAKGDTRLFCPAAAAVRAYPDMTGDLQATANDLRQMLRPMRNKRMGLPVALFAADAALYSAATYMAATSRGPAAWLWGAVAAAATVMLFIVGHDACHGSLTPSARWNR